MPFMLDDLIEELVLKDSFLQIAVLAAKQDVIRANR